MNNTHDHFGSKLREALEHLGFLRGKVIFWHLKPQDFGLPVDGEAAKEALEKLLQTIFEIIGPQGTLVVPAFSYSFCKQEPFDPQNTPSNCGGFSEFLRQKPDAQRSLDPIYSVAAMGCLARELTTDVSQQCFGPGSFWERFEQADGFICNFASPEGTVFLHFLEQRARVPYRFDKLFTGTIIEAGVSRKAACILFCHDQSNPLTRPSFKAFHALAESSAIIRHAALGQSSLEGIWASDAVRLFQTEIKNNPLILTEAGARGVPLSRPQTGGSTLPRVVLGREDGMEQIARQLWGLRRDLVSDGYDVALGALGQKAPMTIHDYPSGTHCFTWIVPEKWTCKEARLETLDQKVVFSSQDNPLHAASYSLPFCGEVERGELFKHLHCHPRLPKAVPFVYKYYERDWGLCCSRDQLDRLRDERYRVVIDTEFSAGSLKVGEIIAPGRQKNGYILCAHLCHPAQFNDDLSGVLVGLEVMQELLRRDDLKYTYRMLILPETIGSAAWLSHNQETVATLLGGLYLEMLARNLPHSLQLSLKGNFRLERVCKRLVRQNDPRAWTGPFMHVICNDERMFNSPGIDVPMVSLSRVLPRDHADYPYREYHTDLDDLDHADFEAMRESKQLILSIIESLETEQIPLRLYEGELFCARYGVLDYQRDQEFIRTIPYLIDGSRSVNDIADETGQPLKSVQAFLDILAEEGLIAWQ